MKNLKEEKIKKHIREVLDGKTESFRWIIENYESEVLKVVVAVLGARQETEEMAQRVFVQAFTHLNKFSQKSDFASWIKAIARNVMRDEFRKLKTQKKHLRLYREHLEVRHQLNERAGEDDSERRDALKECRKKITDTQNAILKSFYSEDKTLGVIAKEIGKSVSATEKLISRARLSLRDCIKTTVGMA